MEEYTLATLAIILLAVGTYSWLAIREKMQDWRGERYE